MPSPLWTHRLSGPAAGIAMARESGHALAWDVNRWLVWLNRAGSVQGQSRQDSVIVAADAADDGSALVVADDRGNVTWFNRDLSVRWKKRIASKPTAIAVDSLGRCLAVADAGNRLHLFDEGGRAVDPVTTARPLYHLHFLASEPFLLGAADFGLVAMLDLRNRQWFWQDSPIIHLGDISASGDGRVAAVTCFSDGVRRYDLAGRPVAALPVTEPCRHVSTAYDGKRFLIGSIFGTVHLLSDTGERRGEQRFDQPLAGLALSPLGDFGALALTDGRVVGLDFSAELQ